MKKVNLLKDKEKDVFYKYLIPSICSTLVTSIYILVDTLIIGKGVGAEGISALNIFLPYFSLYMGIGLMFGIGGGILMSMEDGINNTDKSKKYFVASVLAVSAISILLTAISIICLKEICFLLGATKNNIGLVMEYARCIVYATPIFICTNFLGPIIRNRKEPNLCMISVIVGAVLNIILDYVFVFPMDMGMKGAAIATVIGSLTTSLVLLTHFYKKKNRVKLSISGVDIGMVKKIVSCGSSSFLIEVASGFVIFIFNIQILKYIGDTGVVVYGIISNCILVGNALFNGIAQASQPVISVNHGANNKQRVENVLKYAMRTTVVVGVALFLISFVFTNQVIKVFVAASDEIINIGVPAIRMYLSAFCIMNINILICNYFQSIGREGVSVKISLVRGFILNIILVLTMPIIFGSWSLWVVVPVTEIITFVGILMYRINKVKYQPWLS